MTPPAAKPILRGWQSAALDLAIGSAAREVGSVAGDEQAQTARPLRKCLAAWLGIALALAPFARSSLPVDLAPARAASGFWLVAHDDGMAQARESVPRMQPAQPLALGVLARWSGFETKLGPAPIKPPLAPLSAADQPLAAPKAIGALTSDTREVLHRSSVGTARRPTGPPS